MFSRNFNQTVMLVAVATFVSTAIADAQARGSAPAGRGSANPASAGGFGQARGWGNQGRTSMPTRSGASVNRGYSTTRYSQPAPTPYARGGSFRPPMPQQQRLPAQPYRTPQDDAGDAIEYRLNQQKQIGQMNDYRNATRFEAQYGKALDRYAAPTKRVESAVWDARRDPPTSGYTVRQYTNNKGQFRQDVLDPAGNYRGQYSPNQFNYARGDAARAAASKAARNSFTITMPSPGTSYPQGVTPPAGSVPIPRVGGLPASTNYTLPQSMQAGLESMRMSIVKKP